MKMNGKLIGVLLCSLSMGFTLPVEAQSNQKVLKIGECFERG